MGKKKKKDNSVNVIKEMEFELKELKKSLKRERHFDAEKSAEELMKWASMVLSACRMEIDEFVANIKRELPKAEEKAREKERAMRALKASLQ